MSVTWGAPLNEILGVVAIAAAVYASIFIAVRLAGRRTVSQMSAFDVIVTVAIGSLVATTVLSKDVGYARGMTGMITLLTVQQIVAVIRQRFPAAAGILDFEPQRLYEGGQLELRHDPLSAQITQSELRGKLREQGVRSLDDVQVVILEPSGKISVLASQKGQGSATPIWDQAGE